MGHFSAKSVLFNGTTQYVTMGNVLAFEYTQDLSISFWLKTAPGYSGGGYQVCKQTIGSNQYRGYGAGIGSSGDIGFHLRNDNATNNRIEVRSTTSTLNDGTWHHVAVTWKGNASPVAADLKIYIDSQLETPVVVVDSLSATIVSTAPLNIGARNDGGDAWFAGSLDDVSIFNKELSALEVLELACTQEPRDHGDLSFSNLAGWWWMGDGDTAPTILDHSDNVYHGTMVNAPTIQTDAPAGYYVEPTPHSDLATLLTPVSFEAPRGLGSIESAPFGSGGGGGGGGIIKKYKMRAIDSDQLDPPRYITWIADTPDFLGAGYSGGTPTPVGPMESGTAAVVSEWEE